MIIVASNPNLAMKFSIERTQPETRTLKLLSRLSAMTNNKLVLTMRLNKKCNIPIMPFSRSHA